MQEASDALAETEAALADAQAADASHSSEETRAALLEAEANRALAFKNYHHVRDVKCDDGH